MKRLYLIFFALVIGIQSHAQDVFFSQFYASPLTLNPALTGLSTGDLRINMNYRDQRNNIIPINTQSASFDMKILRPALKENILSVGMLYVNDDQANGLLSSLTGMLSAAFHKSIGAKKNHFISLGFQAGIFQRQLDLNSLQFNTNYNNSTKELIPGADPGLSLSSETSMIFDLNGGLLWYHFIDEGSSIFAGISSFHILEPKETFMGNDEHISRRYVFHGGRRIPLSEQFSIIPNILFSQQSKILLFTGGTSAEYKISDSDAAFKLGAWYRYNDNLVIGSFGFEFMDFEIGISYDILSEVQTISRTQGGLEFSLIYSPALKNVVSLEPNPGTTY